MNDLQIFSNPEFGPVRALTIDGEPWAVGKDVAAALGYKDPAKALSAHVDDEDKGVGESPTPGGKQSVTIINESGLYSLILTSKLPAAKRFKRWITSEVLPALRQTGRYEMPRATQAELPPPPGLDLTEYRKAAALIANCRRDRLPMVLTLLQRSGLDMSGMLEQTAQGTQTALSDEEVHQIVEFVGRAVPEGWRNWSIERRRAFWAGNVTVGAEELVPRDRISALEVWCELFCRAPRDAGLNLRDINTVLRGLPGWQCQTIRPGVGYGTVKGFSRERW